MADRAMTRSSALLERCADDLSAAADHPLLQRFSDGVADDRTFARYVAVEHAFVETATRAVAACLAVEHDRAVAIRLGRIIADLCGDQEEVLAGAADAAPDPGMPAVLERAQVLSRHVDGLVETAGAAGVSVALFAAETLYAGWCAAAAARDVRRAPALQAWIDLHASPDFAAQAAFWGAMVDRIPSDVADAVLDNWFRGTLAAENAFHNAPLDAEEATA